MKPINRFVRCYRAAVNAVRREWRRKPDSAGWFSVPYYKPSPSVFVADGQVVLLGGGGGGAGKAAGGFGGGGWPPVTREENHE